MDIQALVQMRSTLDSLPEAVLRQMEDYGHKYAKGSQVDQDIKDFSCREAIETAYKQAQIQIYVSGAHSLSLERTLTMPMNVYAPWTLARVVLEASSLAAWLLETDIGPKKRVSRSMTVRLVNLIDNKRFAKSSLEQHTEAAKHMQAAQQLVEQEVEHLTEEAEVLGIEPRRNKKDQLIGFEGAMPKIVTLIDRGFSGGSIWRLMSGVAHGREWAVRSLAALYPQEDNGVQLSTAAAAFLISSVLDWFARPTWSYFKANGWDLPRLAHTLEEQYDRAFLTPCCRFWRAET